MTDIVERLRERANDTFTRDHPLMAEAAEAIERLRAALQMIIDDTYDEWAKTIARRALEPKP